MPSKQTNHDYTYLKNKYGSVLMAFMVAFLIATTIGLNIYFRPANHDIHKQSGDFMMLLMLSVAGLVSFIYGIVEFKIKWHEPRLYTAIRIGNYGEVVRELSRGANPHVKYRGESLLMNFFEFYDQSIDWSMFSKRSEKILDKLISHGAKLDQNEFFALFHSRCQYVYLNEKRLLELIKCSNINVQDEDGYTMLHFAAIWHHSNLAQFLIENGANRSIRTRDGRTPLEMVYDNDDFKMIFKSSRS